MRLTSFIFKLAIVMVAACSGPDEADTNTHSADSAMGKTPADAAANNVSTDQGGAAQDEAATSVAKAKTNDTAASQPGSGDKRSEETVGSELPNTLGKSANMKSAQGDGAQSMASSKVTRPAAFAQCAMCHSTDRGDRHLIGPNLFGIVGARAGAKEGYAFSEAMKGADVVWSRDKLGAFLVNPREVVPNTKMYFTGLRDPAERDKIIDYLASLK